ncbi:MAG TPA: Ig-like domain-containing protein [Thermoanaerobaculia bacterium]|nr:Ig-like domain-containing protein [Thermoanaerobaculia bacterium]
MPTTRTVSSSSSRRITAWLMLAAMWIQTAAAAAQSGATPTPRAVESRAVASNAVLPAPAADSVLQTGEASIFGPQKYVRTTGAKDEYTATVSVPAWIVSPYRLIIDNGEPTGENRVSSAVVSINGNEVVDQNDFNQTAAGFSKSVTLTPQTTLNVVLASAPASFLTINLAGKNADKTAPSFSIAAPANGSVTNHKQPRIVIRYADAKGTDEPAASGVDTASLVVKIDNVDRTALFTRRSDEATADLPAELALAEGAHAIVATIKDKAGNNAAANSQFRVDTHAPIVAVAEPARGSYLATAKPAIRITYSDETALALASLSVKINGVDRTAEFTAAATQATWNATTALPEGGNTVAVTIRDTAGNESTASTSFNVDIKKPLLTVNAPVADATYGAKQVDVALTFSDDQALQLSTLEATVDGAAVALTVSGDRATGKTAALADGAHSLVAKISDRAGNATTVTTPFRVDTDLPVVTIDEPLAGAFLKTNKPRIAISFSDTQGIDVATRKFTINGTDRTSSFTLTNNGSPAVLDGTLALPEGSVNVTAEVADLGGNHATGSSRFFIDTIAPAGTVDLSTITNSAAPAVNVHWTDGGSGVDPSTLQITVDGTDRTTLFAIDADGAVGTLATTPRLLDGAHELRATFRDRAGNSTTLTRAFTIDTIAPAAQFIAPADNTFVNTATPLLNLAYADQSGSGIDTASVHVFLRRGSAAETDVTSYFAVGAASATGQIPASAALGEGTHQLRAVIRDAAGNSSETSASFEVDTVAPTFDVVTPARGSFLSDATPRIEIRFADERSGVDRAQLAITLDGTDRTALFAIDANTATATLTAPLAEGAHTLGVTVVDRAGNHAVAAPATFTVDTIKPVVTIAAPLANAYVPTQIPAIQLTFNDGTGSGIAPAWVTILVDGVDRTSEFTITATGAQSALTTPLFDGDHVISVTVLDWAANSGIATAQFHVDTKAPVLNILAPLANAFTNAAAIDAEGTVADASPVTIKVENTNAVVTANGWKATAVPLPATEGAVTLHVVATDLAGNSTTATAVVTVDKTKPVVAITKPLNGAFLKGPSVEVTGTASDSAPLGVEVNDVLATMTNGTFTAFLSGGDGPLAITATARDSAGNVSTSTVQVTVDSGAPVITVTSPAPDFATSAQNATITGTIADATAVTLKINDVLVPVSGGAFSYNAPLATEGVNTFTLVATDAAQNSSSAVVKITADRTAPVVDIASPAANAVVANLPVVVRGTVTDATTTTVTVNGTAATLIGDAWEASFATLPEGEQTFTVVATDAAANKTTVTRKMTLDLNAPVVTIATPANLSFTKNAITTITGTITDVTLQSVTAKGLTGTFQKVEGAANQFTYSIAAVPLADGDNVLQIIATDSATRTGQAQVTVTRDTTAPLVSIDAPSSLTKTATAPIQIAATDNLGTPKVVVTLNGAELQTFTAPPFELTLSVPASANVGDVLVLAVLVTDKAGNTAAATQNIRVVSDGVIVGQVLSDTTGLPVEGARIRVANGTQVATSDARGRYSFTANDAFVTVTIDREDGSVMPVDRTVAIASGTGTVPVDARLTPLAQPKSIGTSGGSISNAPVTVTFAPNALTSAAPLSLTLLSPQGLPNLLPLGWTPLVAFDLRGADAFAGQVSATVSGVTGAMHLVAYRRAMNAWVMVQRDVVASANGVTVALPAPDAYALVVLDNDAAITAPLAGEVLPGVAMQEIPSTAASTGTVTPPVIPPTGGEAKGSVTVTSPAPLPSGTVVQATVNETFTLANGNSASEEKRTEDIVLYRNATNGLAAEVPVVPTRSFANGELAEGRVHLDIFAGREAVRGKTGGNAAVTVTSSDAAISVAASSLPEDTAVSIESAPLSTFTAAVNGVTPFAEVVVDLSGRTLATPAEVSVAAATVAPSDTIVVARVERVDGIARMVVVAAADLLNGRAVTRANADLPGIEREGRYIFYRSANALALIKGTTTANGAPVTALVLTNASPFAAIANATGNYTLAAPAGTITIESTVAQTSLRGTGSIAAAAGQTAHLDLALAGTTSTATITPADGATLVDTATQIDLVSTAALNAATVNASTVRLIKEGGSNVALRFVVSGSGKSVAIIPIAQLDAATRYTVVISGVADIYGGYVTAPQSSFVTKPDTPVQIDTTKLTFTFPDAEGIVHFSAPAGSLVAGSQVMVVNTGNGVVVTFTALNDGSISGELPATIDDRLLITITDPIGNATNFDRSQYVATDGSGRVAVGAGGGVVHGPEGTEIRLPEGALEKGVTFRLETFGPNEFPERPEASENLHWAGGLRVISADKPKLKKEGDLVFAKPADAPDGAFYYVYRRLTGPNGAVAFEFVDHAFVEGTGADAKVVTASYPNIGWNDSVDSWEWAANGGGMAFGLGSEVMFSLMYSWDALWPGTAVGGLLTGNVSRPTWKEGQNEPVYEPVVNAVVTSEAGAHLLALHSSGRQASESTGDSATFARTRSDGVYGLEDPTYFGGTKTVVLTAPESQRALALELDPETSRARKLPIEFRNIATASFALPVQDPPPPSPQIEIHVMTVASNGVRSEAPSYITMGKQLLVGFKSNVGTGFRSFTASIQGNPIPLIEDNYSGDLKMTRVINEPFSPLQADTYTISATVVPLTGPAVTVTYSFLVIGGGSEENNIARSGPPKVLTADLFPKQDAKDVATTVFPVISFSEPVRHVMPSITMLDITEGSTVTYTVAAVAVSAQGSSYVVSDLSTADAETAVRSITVRPSRGLKFGHLYSVQIFGNVIDVTGDSLDSFHLQFTTYKPEAAGASAPPFNAAGVAVIGDRAYVARRNPPHGDVGVFDVSDPEFPHEISASRRGITAQAADIHAEEDSFLGGPLVAVASGINYIDYGPSNLYIYGPDADSLQVKGIVSITQGIEEGVILRFDVKGSLAYVTSSAFTKGLVIVDMQRAAAAYQERVDSGGLIDVYKSINLKGVGWGFRESVVHQTDLFDATGQRIRLYGIKAHDFVIDGSARPLVVIAGSRPLVIADPEGSSTAMFAAEKLELTFDPLKPDAAIGSISLATQVAVTELDGRVLALLGGWGTARVSDSPQNLVTAPSTVLAVIDITNPRQPKPLSFTRFDSGIGRIVVKDRFAIVGSAAAQVVNLTNLSHPLIAGPLPGIGENVDAVDPNLVFSVGWGNTGLNVARFGALRCADLEKQTPHLPSVVNSGQAITRGDYTMKLATGPTGFVVTDLHIGKRLIARKISLPYFTLATSGGEWRCQLKEGAPCEGNSNITGKLVSLKLPETVASNATGFAIEASYLINNIDPTRDENGEPRECCLVVKQRMEFGAEGTESCEASDELSCARFKPIVRYRYLSSPGAYAFKSFNSVQRFDFKPPALDASLQGYDPATAGTFFPHSPNNIAAFFKDCEGPEVILCVGPTATPFGNPMLTEQKHRIIDGGKVGPFVLSDPADVSPNAAVIDNLHLGPASPADADIDGPSLSGHPGCPECVHIHWRWASALEPDTFLVGTVMHMVSPRFDNFGGKAIIPSGSTQDVDVGLTVQEAGDDQLGSSGTWESFYNSGEPINTGHWEYPPPLDPGMPSQPYFVRGQEKPLTFWYSATGHDVSDSFFEHGIFVSSQRLTITNPSGDGHILSGDINFSIKNSYGTLPITWRAEMLDSSTRALLRTIEPSTVTQTDNALKITNLPLFASYIVRVWATDASGWTTKREGVVRLVPIFEKKKATPAK